MEKRYDRLEEIVIGVKKNIDNIEEVQKFNPHHDSKGRFASGKGGAGGGMSHAERDAKEKYGMTMQQMRDAVANDPEANKIASEMLNTQMNAGINHMTFDEVAVLAYTQVHGKKGNESSNSGSLAGKNVYAKDENGVLRRVQPDYVKQVESKIQHHKEKLERLMDKHGPGGNSDRRADIERTKKQLKEYEAEYKGFVVKSFDNIEEVEKANPYHDHLGRFTTGGGGGAMMAPDTGGGGGGSRSSLGEHVHTYPDGTESYEKANAKMPAKEAKNYYTMMDSAIQASFVDQYNAKNKAQIRRSDVDFDRETGTVTVWTGHDPSATGNWNMPTKKFFGTTIRGTKVTHVKPDGKKKVHFSDLKYEFKQTGGKN